MSKCNCDYCNDVENLGTYEVAKKAFYNCDECDGGRWFDASHGSSRHCGKCNGTGKLYYDSAARRREEKLAEAARLLARYGSR